MNMVVYATITIIIFEMEQYIKKSSLLAEIENLLDNCKYHDDYDCAFRDGNNAALYALKGRINTIETKEVEFNTFSVLAEHLLACYAHGVSPKYNERELDLNNQNKT